MTAIKTQLPAVTFGATPTTGALRLDVRSPIREPGDLASTAEIMSRTAKKTQEDLIKEQNALERKRIALEMKSLESSQEEAARLKKTLPVVAGVGGVAEAVGAGFSTVPTTDVGSAVLQTAGAGLSGAASGALAGSVIPGLGTGVGAAIGGIVGLVSGGITQYLGLKSARAERRRSDSDAREIRRLNERARREALKQQAFNNKIAQEQLGLKKVVTQADLNKIEYGRRTDALKARWDMMQGVRNQVNSLIQGDEKLKELFIRRAR